MHICFAALDYPSSSGGGGVGNQVRTLARRLRARGHAVSVVALRSQGLPARSDDGGIAVYRVDVGNWHWYAGKLPLLGDALSRPLRELEYSQAVYQQVRAIQQQQPIDLIETTETGGFWLARWLRAIPQLARLHGEQFTFRRYTPGLPLTLGARLGRLLQRAALRRARALISPSQAHARSIRAELGAACPPITVIPNCIDLSHGLPDGQGAADCEILFVGRIERVKGIPVLLEALAEVLRECPQARLLLAGAPHPNLPQRDLQVAIQRLGLGAHVQLMGHMPPEELARLYRRATICVQPSFYETFGVAALEAMSYGVPVVATLAGGLPEVLGDAGVLVPPGDAPALARALIGLLRDPLARQQLGYAGQLRARSLFSAELVMEQTLALYEQQLGARAGAAALAPER